MPAIPLCRGGDVRVALDNGVAAATLVSKATAEIDDGQLRFAFDGDAVLFSDEAEQVFKREGLDAFAASEDAARRRPLMGGPFKNFLAALQRLQQALPAEKSPIRTALVTARSAPAHERVIRTLRAWGIRIDESIFLGGLTKTEFLKAYGADVFSMTSGRIARTRVGISQRATCRMGSPTVFKTDYKKAQCLLLFLADPQKAE